MPYATSLELVVAFGAKELAELSTPERFDVVTQERLELAIEGTAPVTGDADENALEAAIDAINAALAVADSIVDSYIATRYTLPLAVTPVSLRKRTLDLARYELMDQRATESAEKRRDDAIAWLKGIAAGTVLLGDKAIDSGAGSDAGIKGVTTLGQKFSNIKDSTGFDGYGFI